MLRAWLGTEYHLPADGGVLLSAGLVVGLVAPPAGAPAPGPGAGVDAGGLVELHAGHEGGVVREGPAAGANPLQAAVAAAVDAFIAGRAWAAGASPAGRRGGVAVLISRQESALLEL